MAHMPTHDELRTELVRLGREAYPQHDGYTVGGHTFRKKRPAGWAGDKALLSKYGYPATAAGWREMTWQVFGLVVLTQAESARVRIPAARSNLGPRSCDEAIDVDEIPKLVKRKRTPGIACCERWRDVREWDWRAKTWVTTGQVKVYGLR